MEKEILKACTVVRAGGVILYPTDTVWGIGCDATNANAVQKIYEIKRRSNTRSMLVLIDSEDYLSHYVKNLPNIAPNLISLSVKPLTIIYSGAKNVAPNLIASDGTLGIRVTREIFSKHLCQQLKKPLVSTSANISGQSTPAVFSEISLEIKQAVDYVVNYRQDETQKAQASSVIQLEKNGMIKIIRK